MDSFAEFRLRLHAEFFERLAMTPDQLAAVPVAYREVHIAKRSGGMRNLSIPVPELLATQRRLNKAILQHLPKSAHAMGFVPFRSIAKHAARHASRGCVVRLDISDFFDTTSAERVRRTLSRYGWSDAVIGNVMRICMHPSKDGLPQGAATSPTLSNIVNLDLDRRLAGLARRFSGRYSRYADDITFSFLSAFHRKPGAIRNLLKHIRSILKDHGYVLNDRKTAVMGRCTRQVVTGLVVNDKASLPREVRRRLRAAEHRHRLSQQMVQVAGPRPAQPMTTAQLHGWRALRSMTQRAQALPGWRSLVGGTPEDHLRNVRALTCVIDCLDGVSTRAPAGSGAPMDVGAFLHRVRNTDIIRSRFDAALATVDRAIEEWRSSTLGRMQGLVAIAAPRRGLLAVGVDREDACRIIGVDPDAEATNSEHWRTFFRGLCMRGLTGVEWISCDATGALDAWRSEWSAWRRGASSFGYLHHGSFTEAGIVPTWLLRSLPDLSERADPRHRRVAWVDLMLTTLPPFAVSSAKMVTPTCELPVHSVGHNFWSVLSRRLLWKTLKQSGSGTVLRFERTSRSGEIDGYLVPYAAIEEGLQQRNLSHFRLPPEDELDVSVFVKHRWHIRIVNDVLSIVKDDKDVWSCSVAHFRISPDSMAGS